MSPEIIEASQVQIPRPRHQTAYINNNGNVEHNKNTSTNCLNNRNNNKGPSQDNLNYQNIEEEETNDNDIIENISLAGRFCKK